MNVVENHKLYILCYVPNFDEACVYVLFQCGKKLHFNSSLLTSVLRTVGQECSSSFKYETLSAG